ncbi:F-box protein SKIP24-like [Musa acuminata AAA Group]|uniref:F-box protein SKIP24-like n=1 Tax=Musa acuminata AAA Group TaxID=214697 RepID=UPI0031D0CC34
MSVLPDEIWSLILEMGTAFGRLTYRDLCALAIASRRLNRLARDPALWATLLALDFPAGRHEPHDKATSVKSLYRIRFERDKARQLAAARRAVLYAQSRVAASRKRLEELESSLAREGKRLKAAVSELADLERARTASVALNVWQPHVVRGRQKQIVEQCTVPVESRLGALKMEIKVCKQQIAIFNKAYNEEKKKLSEYNEALTSLKYHPLRSNFDSTIRHSNKRKRLKQSSDLKYGDGPVEQERVESLPNKSI